MRCCFLFFLSLFNSEFFDKTTYNSRNKEESPYSKKKKSTERKLHNFFLKCHRKFDFSGKLIHIFCFKIRLEKKSSKKKFEIYIKSLPKLHVHNFNRPLFTIRKKKSYRKKELRIQLDSPGAKHELQLGIELRVSESQSVPGGAIEVKHERKWRRKKIVLLANCTHKTKTTDVFHSKFKQWITCKTC